MICSQQRFLFASLAALMFGFTNTAQAVMAWQPVAAAKKQGMSHNRHASMQFKLTEHADSQVSLLQPDLFGKPLKPNGNAYTIRPTGMDNYHALVAVYEGEGYMESAIRYLYLRGKPSGESPRLLTATPKTAFEIVPSPLPREHRRYETNHDVVFVLRHNGGALANNSVSLSTSQGTTLSAMSDRNGAVRFTLPDDFKVTKPGRKANRPAEFVVSSEHSVDGVSYRSSMSAAYYVDPNHWLSTELGFSVLALGFISGLGINKLTASSKQNRRTV